jgi:hypothetical protein
MLIKCLQNSNILTISIATTYFASIRPSLCTTFMWNLTKSVDHENEVTVRWNMFPPWSIYKPNKLCEYGNGDTDLHVIIKTWGKCNNVNRSLKWSLGHVTYEWVSDCCLTSIQQFFSYIMARENKSNFNEMMMRSALY